MSRISMGRAIGDAYDFAFGKYFAVLGVIWLPLVVFAVAEVFVLGPYMRAVFELVHYAAQHAHEKGLAPELSAHAQRIQGFGLLIGLVSVMFTVWIRVGVTKAALGLPRGPHFAYFFLGLDELRVFGAYLLYIVMIYAAMFAFAIVFVVVMIISAALVAGGVFAHMDASGAGLLVAAMLGFVVLAIFGALIYVQARLMFLLVPVTVVEKRFGLWRSWELSRGNFWRIVVIAIGTLSPVILAEFVLILAFYLPLVIGFFVTLHDHPELLHNPQTLNPAAFMHAAGHLLILFPVAGLIGLAIAPLVCGLTFSPQAYAYRSLMPQKETSAG